MRSALVLLALALSFTGCKKGGGGGGWFVGEQGLMVNVTEEGKLGEGYDLGASETLNAIACRYIDEAWVVGDSGTLLYTSDAGASWDTHELGTAANLRALATQDAGPVFIAGNGVFFASVPEFTTGNAQWKDLGDGVTQFRSIAAAQRAKTVLAVSDDGGIWSYDGALARRATLEGARAIAVSPDGTRAIVAGNGLAVSVDGGATWTQLAAPSKDDIYNSIRIDDEGNALAVGNGGLVAKIDVEGRVLRQTLSADLLTVHTASYSGHGYAAGSGGQTFMTDDGGWTWQTGPNVGRTVLGVDEIGDGHN